jgi:HAMP domain-containing protein
MKITTKLILAIIIGLAITALLINRAITLYTQNALKKEISAHHLTVTRKIMQEVDEVLYERTLDIKALGRDRSFADALTNSPTSTKTMSAAARENLEQTIKENRYWKNIYLLDRQGNIVTSAKEQDISIKISDLEIYKKALNGNAHYSDAILLENRKLPIQFFTAPVRSSKPGVPGVLVAQLDWEKIIDLLKTDSVSSSYLFNDKGALIGISEENKQHLIGEIFEDNQALAHGLQGKEDMAITLPGLIDNSRFLTAHAMEKGFSDYKGKNWVLIVEHPISSAFVQAKDIAFNLLIFAIPVAALLALILISLVYKLIFKPLKNLNDVIDKITAGDLEQRAYVERDDEIGELAKKFNKMTAKLQKTKKSIQDQVDEKTEDLKKINRHLTGREIKMAELKKENKKLKKELKKKKDDN